MKSVMALHLSRPGYFITILFASILLLSSGSMFGFSESSAAAQTIVTAEQTMDYGKQTAITVGGTMSGKDVDRRNDFIRHGIAAEVSRPRGIAVATGRDGDPVVLIWLMDAIGVPGLLTVDPETGKSQLHETPMDNFGPPFAFLLSRQGLFYSLSGHHFVEFDPRRNTWGYVGEVGDLTAMAITESDDGTIWAGTYPAAHLVSFDPSEQSLTDHGPMNEENWPQYPRAMTSDDSGWIYIAIGMTNAHLLGRNPETGEVKPLIDEDQRAQGQPELFRGTDGRAYVELPGFGHWHVIYEGELRELEGDPPVEARQEAGGWQEYIAGDFPDGRRLADLDVPEGLFHVEKPDGSSRRVEFDYPSRGAYIHSLHPGPDGKLYGSTGHPLYIYRYHPEQDSFENMPFPGGHVNAVTTQSNKVYGAIYVNGRLIEIDPALPLENGQAEPDELADAGEIIDRPHEFIAHPDGRHVIMTGTPGYGLTGGGMMIYDLQSREKILYEHTDLLEHHSTKSLAVLPDGNLAGGTTIQPGTGGETVAEVAELYLFDWESRQVIHREVILPGMREIRELKHIGNGQVIGLTDDATIFIYDTRERELLHSETLVDNYGPVTGGQAPRVWATGPDEQIYCLFRDAIVRINPDTLEHEKLAESPVTINAGVALLDGRLYFTSGPDVWSYRIPAL